MADQYSDAASNRQRFADTVRIEAMDGGFIRSEHERRLLQEGMSRFGLSLEEARGVLLTMVNDQGYVLQRQTESEIGEFVRLNATHGKNRKLSRDDFEQAAAMYRAKTKGRMSLHEARLRVKSIMEEGEIGPKRSGWIIRSKRWYNAIKA